MGEKSELFKRITAEDKVRSGKVKRIILTGPSKQPKKRKTAAHIINPRENHTIRPCH